MLLGENVSYCRQTKRILQYPRDAICCCVIVVLKAEQRVGVLLVEGVVLLNKQDEEDATEKKRQWSPFVWSCDEAPSDRTWLLIALPLAMYRRRNESAVRRAAGARMFLFINHGEFD